MTLLTEVQRSAASELTGRLKADANVLAVALCLPANSGLGREAPALEMLIVVSKMPFDLDLLGMRKVVVKNSEATLFFATHERLRSAIEDEGGCWFTSGRVLYSETLYDRTGLMIELRKAVNSVSREKRLAAFATWFDEARAFPTMAMQRGITSKDAPDTILLRDNAALARALFLLNSRPPRSPVSLMDDAKGLQRLPQGFKAIAEILRGFDRLDLRKFRKARKAYNALISDIRNLAKVL